MSNPHAEHAICINGSAHQLCSKWTVRKVLIVCRVLLSYPNQLAGLMPKSCEIIIPHNLSAQCSPLGKAIG